MSDALRVRTRRRSCFHGPSTQRRGWAACAASLRRPRFAPAPLRCSLRGAAAMHSAPAPGRGRPINASRRSGATRRTAPAALRCSAPQRRSTRRPPAPLREPTVQLATGPRVATTARSAPRRAARCARNAVGGRAAECLCGAEERSAAGLERPRCVDAVRAPSRGSSRSEMRPCEGRVVEVAPRSEHRRAVGAQRRPPQRSAAARPPTALLARSPRRRDAPTAAAKRSRSPAHALARSVDPEKSRSTRQPRSRGFTAKYARSASRLSTMYAVAVTSTTPCTTA